LLRSRLRLFAGEAGLPRPAQHGEPLLDEPGQAAGVARVEPLRLGLGGLAPVGRELRLVARDQVLDLGEREPAGHGRTPAPGPSSASRPVAGLVVSSGGEGKRRAGTG
jgi:hypothetical protein